MLAIGLGLAAGVMLCVPLYISCELFPPVTLSPAGAPGPYSSAIPEGLFNPTYTQQMRPTSVEFFYLRVRRCAAMLLAVS